MGTTMTALLIRADIPLKGVSHAQIRLAPPQTSGKTVYFCVRYENAKGEPGPWGPIFSAVIP